VFGVLEFPNTSLLAESLQGMHVVCRQ